jgi:putative intracellular protease/amidase
MKIKNRSQIAVESLDDRLCLSANQAGLELPVDHRLALIAEAPPPQAGVCHGTTVLAWARVDGVSPLQQQQSDAAFQNLRGTNTAESAIVFVGGWGSSMYQYAHNDPASAVGRGTAADDVIVDGRIITGEFYDATEIASHGYIKIKKLNSGG